MRRFGGTALRGWKGRFWKEEVLCRVGSILGDDMSRVGNTRRVEVRWFSFLFWVSLLVLSLEGFGGFVHTSEADKLMTKFACSLY